MRFFKSVLAFWMVFCTGLAHAGALPHVGLNSILGHKEHWPQPCDKIVAGHAGVCLLSGPGGLIYTWDEWAKAGARAGKTFVVRGICASACERAYRIAKARGARVIVLPGARLIYHKPQPWTKYP